MKRFHKRRKVADAGVQTDPVQIPTSISLPTAHLVISKATLNLAYAVEWILKWGKPETGLELLQVHFSDQGTCAQCGGLHNPQG